MPQKATETNFREQDAIGPMNTIEGVILAIMHALERSV